MRTIYKGRRTPKHQWNILDEFTCSVGHGVVLELRMGYAVVKITNPTDGQSAVVNLGYNEIVPIEREKTVLDLVAEREALTLNGLCGTCAGTDKHASGLPCICGGLGTVTAERDAMRQELASRAEAIVALTAEVERLRPVVEAARAYRLSEIAYDAEIDRQRAFPDSAVHLQVSRDFDDTEVALTKAVDALLATESGEGK